MATIIKIIAFIGETIASMAIQASTNRLFKFIVSKTRRSKTAPKIEPANNTISEFDLSAFPNRADETENKFQYRQFPKRRR